MSFRAAIAQTDSRVGDVEGNIRHHLEFIDRARTEGAQLILFPELSLSGYSLRDLAWDTAVDVRTSRLLDPLKQASRSISIVAGIAESGEDHGIYNSAVFFEDGEVKHIHRKIYPPTYGMFEEGRYFRAGQDVRAVSSKVGRLGMLICEDCWHLSLPYLLAIDGAEVLLCLTASPTRIAGDNPELDNARVNHEHQRVYARLLSTYVLFANRVGFEDGVNFWGGSLAVDPFGNPIKQAPLFKEDLMVVDIETSEVQRARRFSRHFLDENLDLVKKHLLRLTQSS
ncbi:MAG TPA: nitrilase-related carbon-nitrogen hydrolase [Bacteroidota bacterium]|nr:nitrilase-related carbon-nitrogen hydrolase [Bacteroidota bacterium]